MRLREERGSVVLTALVMTFLLGVTALAADVGLIYLERWQLSNATDAGALAGIQDLPGSPAQARQKAGEFFRHNQSDDAAVEIAIAPDNKEIRVAGSRTVSTFFARIFGVESAQVQTRAAAKVGTMKSVVGLAPLAIPDQTLLYGHQYILKLASHGAYLTPGVATSVLSGGYRVSGNFGAIALGGRGAHQYEMNLKYGYDTQLSVGDTVPTEPGNMAGPTVRGVEYRLSQCTHVPRCTVDNYRKDCPRLVTLPIIAGFGNGRSDVEILGFAAFLLEDTGNEGKGKGKASYVIGRFIKRLLPGEIGSGNDYGMSAYRLVE